MTLTETLDSETQALNPVEVVRALEPLVSNPFSFSEEQIAEFVKLTQDTNILHTPEAVKYDHPGIVVPANQIAMAYEVRLRECLVKLSRTPGNFWLKSLSFILSGPLYAGQELEPSAHEQVIETQRLKLSSPYTCRQNGSQKRIDLNVELEMRQNGRRKEDRRIKPMPDKDIFIHKKYAFKKRNIERLGEAIGVKGLDYVPSMLFPSFVTSTLLAHAVEHGKKNMGYNVIMNLHFSGKTPKTGCFDINISDGSHRYLEDIKMHKYVFHAQCTQNRRVVASLRSFVTSDEEASEELFRRPQSQP